MLAQAIAAEALALMKEVPSVRSWRMFCRRVNGESWMECWEWTGYVNHDGYSKAHRKMARWMYGKPAKQSKRTVIDHIVCDNPPCANPLHLRYCTDKENGARTNSVTAVHARSSHCPRGHERTADNQTIGHKNYYGNHVRACKQCTRDRGRAWARKNYALNKEKMREVARNWQRQKARKAKAV